MFVVPDCLPVSSIRFFHRSMILIIFMSHIRSFHEGVTDFSELHISDENKLSYKTVRMFDLIIE